MSPLILAEKIKEWYVGYLQTMFYFRDPELRNSFNEALLSGYIGKGPFIESTPVFKRTKTFGELVRKNIGLECDPGFIKALNGDRLLYKHQEDAILRQNKDRNIVVATGTGS